MAGMQQRGAASTSSSAAVLSFDRSSSSRLGAPGAESFDSALRELKDLRSQLHEAADCCEKAFVSTEKKKLILESTKSYICDAVVTVIDHLGTVSSKLENTLHEKTDVTQTERKINLLKQRLLTCEQYAISLKLLTVRGDPDAIQYHRRYTSQSTQRNKEETGAGSSKHDPELPEIAGPTVDGITTIFKPYDVQPAIRKCPVDTSKFVLGKEQTMTTADDDENPRAIRKSFSFRAEDVHIMLGDHKKKASHGSNLLSFLKKTRRKA